MECLRYGSQQPAEEIGCCAIDIFQGFDCDPDNECEIPRFLGDSLESPVTDPGGDQIHYGPTYGDAFRQFLRTGTFDDRDRPDHIFLAVFSAYQLETESGLKWLRLLKEYNFEFIRTINNSVYDWSRAIVSENPDHLSSPSRVVYLFGLFRNISTTRVPDPFTPPQVWQDLPEPSMTPTETWLRKTVKEEWITPDENNYSRSSVFALADE